MRATRARRFLAVAAALAVTAAGGWGVSLLRSDTPPEHSADDLMTFTLSRTTLSASMRLTIQLGYGDVVGLAGPETGTLTALPAAGDVIAHGQRMYEVDGQPVIVLPGARPLWRTLSLGMQGEDVLMLKQALASLGYEVGDVTSDTYDSATVDAVDALYASLGYGSRSTTPVTEKARDEAQKTLDDTKVALAQAQEAHAQATTGPTRSEIAAADAAVATAQRALDAAERDLTTAKNSPASSVPGSADAASAEAAAPVLSVADAEDSVADARDALSTAQAQRADLTATRTGDTTTVNAAQRAVDDATAALTSARSGSVGPSDLLFLDTPSVRVSSVVGVLGAAAAGTVLSYTGTTISGTTTLSADQARQLTAGSEIVTALPSGAETTAVVSAVSTGGETTDDGSLTEPSATFTFADQDVLREIGLPALRGRTVSAEAADALVVPVTSLIATAEGGYAVEVVRAGVITRIPVEIGLIADTRAEVVSDTLVEGDRIVMPS